LAPVRPEAAFFGQDLSEFILPYDAVRTAEAPERALLDFLQSTYEAAATTGNWDRAALECPIGIAGVPRKNRVTPPRDSRPKPPWNPNRFSHCRKARISQIGSRGAETRSISARPQRRATVSKV
jgi:uncharacterized protein DUF5996